MDKEAREAKAKKEAELALKRKNKKTKKREKEEVMKTVGEDGADSVLKNSAKVTNLEIVEKHLKIAETERKLLSPEATKLAIQAKSDLLANITKIRAAIQHIDDLHMQNDKLDLFRKLNHKKFCAVADLENSPNNKNKDLLKTGSKRKTSSQNSNWDLDKTCTSHSSKARRSELISKLVNYANRLPIWIPLEKNEQFPKFTGKLQEKDDDIIYQPGQKVACNIKNVDRSTGLIRDDGNLTNKNSKAGSSSKIIHKTESINNSEDCWYLGEIISYDKITKKYLIADYDSDTDETWKLPIHRILTLPSYQSPALICNFKPDDVVLALYPQTTCFYKAIIHEVKEECLSEYLVIFEDGNYEEGWSPPMPVHKRYVIAAPTE